MAADLTPLDLAEQVARIAADLGIQTAVIGAYALAAHGYMRATKDVDLATDTAPSELIRLQGAVEAAGLHTRLRQPDHEDLLGGVLLVWTDVDKHGDPLEPLDVVNFNNPYRPQRNPAQRAIRDAISLPERPLLRYPQLVDLVALKLFAGGRRDDADVVDLLAGNAQADFEAIRATAKSYGFDRIDVLIAEAEELIRRSGS